MWGILNIEYYFNIERSYANFVAMAVGEIVARIRKVTTDTNDSSQYLESVLAHTEIPFGKRFVMRLGQRVDVVEASVVQQDIGGMILFLVAAVRLKGVSLKYTSQHQQTTLRWPYMWWQSRKLPARCVFLDTEHVLDTSDARTLGSGIGSVMNGQPENGEHVLGIPDTFVRKDGVDVLINDKVAALVPKAVLVSELVDSHMGLQARLMSHTLHTGTSSASNTNCRVVFINQTRQQQ